MSLHTHTPALSVIDPRRLVVRRVAWYRANDRVPARPRVTRSIFDEPGHEIGAADPRLFDVGLCNVQRVHGLSGGELFIDSVDAGWRSTLGGADGQSRATWDSRGSRSIQCYDDQMRLRSVEEGLQGETLRVVERLEYGPPDATGNGRGRLLRHDDACGSHVCERYGVQGTLLHERRRFLKSLDVPDWPELLEARDTLLEAGEGYATCYRFDAAGASVQQVDAAGHSRFSRFDLAGLPSGQDLRMALSTRCRTLASGIHYDASARFLEETSGNGAVTRCEYGEADGRLLRLRVLRQSTEPLQDLRYAYDPVGNIVSIADDAQVTRFGHNQRVDPVSRYGYDSLYQLVEASGREVTPAADHPGLPPRLTDPNQLRNYRQAFDYDPAGNLLARHHLGAPTWRMAVSSVSNRSVVASTDGSLPDEAEIQAAFDGNGNQRELLRGQAMAWDVRNQLARVTLVQREEGPNDSELYRYGADGMRLRKVSFSRAGSRELTAETRYLPGLELHSDEATSEQWEVVSLNGGHGTVRVLHWHAGLPEALMNDEPRYSFADHLGSSVLELDDEGALVGQEGYYPFGGTAWWAARNVIDAKYRTKRYGGKTRDPTGLIYYGFRYYPPWLQRWLTPDPIGTSVGLGLYSFVGNSPITHIEWDGRIFGRPYSYIDRDIEAYQGTVRFEGLGNVGAVKRQHILRQLHSVEAALSDALVMVDAYPADSSGIMADYFGPAHQTQRSNIVKRWERTRFFASTYGSGQADQKIVGVEMPRNGPIGFISRLDTAGTVVLNVEHLESPTLDITLAHELSHLVGVKSPGHFSVGANTLDYFYLGSEEAESLTRDDYDFERNRSAQLMSGRNPLSTTFMLGHPEIVQEKFIYQTRQFARDASSRQLEKAVASFNEQPVVKSGVAARNADSLALSAFALQRRYRTMSSHSRVSVRTRHA